MLRKAAHFKSFCVTIIQLLEELSEASVEGDTSEANANMEKNRYTYNLPCTSPKNTF